MGAKQNLGRKMATRPKGIKPVDPAVEMLKHITAGDDTVPYMYRCVKCGKQVMDDDKEFMVSFSKFHVGNRCKLPLCKDCIDASYEEYLAEYGNEEDAVRRMCMQLDIYYCQELVDTMKKASKPLKRMTFYITKSHTAKYANKTYEDTIAEEKSEEEKIVTYEDMYSTQDIDPDTVAFWGSGFSPEDYEYLDSKYSEWILSYPVQAKAMEAIIQKICLLELQITKGIQRGDKVDSLCKAMNDLMNSAGIQPKQSSENTMSDTASFGALIKRWEDEEPIPEPDEKWKDVDGIRRYISVFFFGHLAKMFGVKNNWSKLYDDEIKKYTVDRPELEDEDVNQITYEDLFGSGDEA